MGRFGKSAAAISVILILCVIYLYTTQHQDQRMRVELERHSMDLEKRLDLPPRYDAHAPRNRKRHALDVESRRLAMDEAEMQEARREQQQPEDDGQELRSGRDLRDLLADVQRLREQKQRLDSRLASDFHDLRSQISRLEQQQQQNIDQPQVRDQAQVQAVPAPNNINNNNKFANQLGGETIATLLLTYNRPEYLQRTLANVFEILPEGFPLFVSQDGNDARTAQTLRSHPRAGDFTVFSHLDRPAPRNPSQGSYWYISQHFGWALGKLFREYPGYSAVIIIEDDLNFAPDFYSYFMAALPVMRRDPTLWCISAWNDIGNEGLVHNPRALRRTDFFPGLGWLMTRELWNELGQKWPDAYWDDWMREPAQRRGRQCIHPEISRSGTFGKAGSSGGQFFDLISRVKLNSVAVDFAREDLSYLEQANWDHWFWSTLFRELTPITRASDIAGSGKKFVYYYSDQRNFEGFVRSLPRKFQIISDEKAGVPRSSYAGVVYFDTDENSQLFIAPQSKRF